MRIAARVPDHLGDAVMALAAVQALARLGDLTVHARGPWAPELYAGLAVTSEAPPESADLAVMFKPSAHVARTWRHLPTLGVGPARRYARALPDVPEHRRDRYARLVTAAGAPRPGPSRYEPRGRAPDLPERFVALNPWSPSRTVRWPGFPELARRLAPVPVVVFCGPGEEGVVRDLVGAAVPIVAGLRLPDFAAALDGCVAFVSNDSGGAHFAAACGADVVMVHGSTAPERTGVGIAVERPSRLWCQPCYRKWCGWGRPCLDVPVAAVEAEVLRLWGRGRCPRNAPGPSPG
jgi:ADP-heptose:LPS heptosyltransferase